MPDAVDDRPERLLGVLTSLVVLLAEAGARHWVAWIETARDQIARGDPSGLDHLLRAYGGMGSLNDIYLEQDPQRFDALKGEAWTLATDLARDLNNP